MLFGCYRRGDANDPDTYVAAISAVLSSYDVDIIREVTDPRTGINTDPKYMSFMPNAGELKVYCETIAARRDRLKRLASIPSPNYARLPAPETPAGALANTFVPEGHQRYARLVEWTKTAEAKFWRFGKSSDGRQGIWIAWHIWDGGPTIGRTIGQAAKAAASNLESGATE
jgi:hypothetical protein